MVKQLKTNNKYSILVDMEDYERLSKYTWYARKDTKSGKRYATAYTYTNGKRIVTGMHRLLLGLSLYDGKIVDHINGNTLDNRKSNLRLATRGQNKSNSTVSRNNKLGCKGVLKLPSGNFGASIRYNKICYYLGTYPTLQEASDAYDSAAVKYHGEYARTNNEIKSDEGDAIEFGWICIEEAKNIIETEGKKERKYGQRKKS